MKQIVVNMFYMSVRLVSYKGPDREPAAFHSPDSEAERSSSEKELQWAKWKIRALEERLRLEMIRKYGPKSETFSDALLELLELEPGHFRGSRSGKSTRAHAAVKFAHRGPKKNRKHPGRQELPADLARVERVIACTPEQCVCKGCGQDTVVIGYEQSEQLDVEPARYLVVVTNREKRACNACAEAGVSAAALPGRIIDKGLVSDRVVIDTIVAKYCDHLPLYRQSAILERETGLTISRATMDGWVMSVSGYWDR